MQVKSQKNDSNYIENYKNLIAQFNAFKQESILQKEKFYSELEKHKQVNDNFVKKLEKKYQHLLKEERSKLQKQKQKSVKKIEYQKQSFQNIIRQKCQTIEELSSLVLQLQRQKRQVIEENTRSLLQLARSQDKHIGQSQYSSQEIMKMYQYLLQENQALKKQLSLANFYKNPEFRSYHSPNNTKSYNRKEFVKKGNKEIIYTQESNKKVKSPSSDLNISKNHSFVNSIHHQKQDRNLHRVKSNTSQNSSKIKKQIKNINANIDQSVQQVSQIQKSMNNKKKVKPPIPTVPIQKKKPL